MIEIDRGRNLDQMRVKEKGMECDFCRFKAKLKLSSKFAFGSYQR